MLRLKDLFNVKISWVNGTPTFTYVGDSLADARAAKEHIVQWLPALATIACTIRGPSGGNDC
ncbi:MAG: hypothetical protein Q7T80_10795 [Methanoregula sp.]|nr:hypothetical protein [Methanoregula sp.]